MKKKFTTLLLILFTVIAALQAQPDSIMQQVCMADSINNADMYYNVGVDLYASGEPALANLSWLKALNLNSAHSKSRANLELSQRLSPDSALYPPRAFLERVIYQFLNFFSVNRLAVLSLILLASIGVAVAWLLGYDPNKERALPIMVLSLLIIFGIGDITALGIKYYQQKHNDQGVIVSPRCSLYDSKGRSEVQELHAGLVIRILDKKNDHYMVMLPNGQKGRLATEAVRKVIPD